MSELEEQVVAPDDQFDIVVIGAGPGGYVAAGRAAQLGLRTAVVERAELGGICLNWGCIPTKALLHGAQVARTMRTAGRYGILTGEPQVDIRPLVEHSRRTAGQLSSGIATLMAARGAEVIAGEATLAGRGEVRVRLGDGRTRHLQAAHVVIATGSRARLLPGTTPGPDGVWTYREALVPDRAPETLVVIGSGAIGSEFASLFCDLGSTVTLLEVLDRVMPGEDPAVSQLVEKSFRRRGIQPSAGVSDVRVEPGQKGTTVRYRDREGTERSMTADRVLMAIGVQPNTEGLGLEDLGVLDERGFVTVDDHGSTGVWGLHAIGDVTGGPCLAHKASEEALRCIDAIAGVERSAMETDWRSWVPRCTYTTPEVASIGFTADQARQRGHKVVARPVRMAENGRALGAGETEGFATVVLDSHTHEILGATIVGAEATELIAMLSVAHAGGIDADALAHAVIAHPSRAETVHESILAGLGRPVNSV